MKFLNWVNVPDTGITGENDVFAVSGLAKHEAYLAQYFRNCKQTPVYLRKNSGGVHFWMKIYGPEIMAYHRSPRVVSEFTLSIMDDLGLYQNIRTNIEKNYWAQEEDCSFLNVPMTKTEADAKFPMNYCSLNNAGTICDALHTSSGICGIPMVEGGVSGFRIYTSDNSRFCKEDTRCFRMSIPSLPSQGLCIRPRCSKDHQGLYKLDLTSNDGYQYTCSKKGIFPHAVFTGAKLWAFTMQNVFCPDPQTFCDSYMHFCPKNCWGNGKCEEEDSETRTLTRAAEIDKKILKASKPFVQKFIWNYFIEFHKTLDFMKW